MLRSFPDCFSGLGTRLGTRLYIAHGLRSGNETSHTIPTPALWTNLVVSSPRPKLVSCTAVHTLGQLGTRLNQTLSRGITTNKICVEVFATGNQSIKALFESQSRDQGHLQTATKDQECTAAIWPLTHKKIKWSRALEGTIKQSSTLFANQKILIPVANASTGNIQVTTPYLSAFSM